MRLNQIDARLLRDARREAGSFGLFVAYAAIFAMHLRESNEPIYATARGVGWVACAIVACAILYFAVGKYKARLHAEQEVRLCVKRGINTDRCGATKAQIDEVWGKDR